MVVHIGIVDVVVFASYVIVDVVVFASYDVVVIAVLSTYKQRQLKKLQRQSKVKQFF
jgi:hypothetical protein